MHDLPVDVLLLIFEQLNLYDLLNVSEADELLLPSTTWVFRQNYFHSQSFNIDSIDCTLYMSKKNITLNNKSTEKLLNIFGSSIQDLSISYSYLKPNLNGKINQLIRDKCSENVQVFSISFYHGILHSGLIPAIFPNVEQVNLCGAHLGNIVDCLGEKFPKLNTLQLISNNSNSDHLIDHHFPHLETVMCENLNENVFKRLLQRNPQIKSVYVGGSTNFLRIMHDNLMNLERLEIGTLPWCPDRTIPFYHFETVKNFTLHLYPPWDRRNFILQKLPFVFENLEKMELHGQNSGEIQSSGFQQYIPFIENHPNIRELTLLHDNCLKYAYLGDLNLPHLEELKLQGINLNAYNTTEFEDFFNGMKQREKAVKIHLMRYSLDTIDTLNQKLGTDWSITFVNTNRMEYYYDETSYIDITIVRERD